MSEKPARIVVGVDGSMSSLAALRWATKYASSVDGALEVLTAWKWPVTYGYPVPPITYEPELDAKVIAEEALDTVGLPAEQVTVTVVKEEAARALVRASTTADLVVVGSHGHRTATSILLGSVSNYCAHHSVGPLAIVRPEGVVDEPALSGPPVISVGIDGSPASERAIRWAARYAAKTGGTVRFVAAWAWPEIFGTPMISAAVDLATAAEGAVADAIAIADLPAEQVEQHVAEGAAGPALVVDSSQADLLVVGSRGESALRRTLLGSVSTYCLHHAVTPVVVVR